MDRGEIDLSCPVDWSDPSNAGTAAWWLAVPEPGWWGGLTWRDLCGVSGRKASHGTMTGMALPAASSGWRGPGPRPGGFGCVQFDGTDDYVDCGSVPARDAPPVTLAAWVRPSGFATNGTIFGSASAGGTANFLQLRINTSGALELVVAGVALVGSASTTALSAGVWAHCMAVVTATTYAFYINGLPAGSGSHAQTFIAQPVALGTRYPGSAEYFAGFLDDCRIWSRDLSAAAARTYYDLSRRGYSGVLARPASRTLIAASAAPPARFVPNTMGLDFADGGFL